MSEHHDDTLHAFRALTKLPVARVTRAGADRTSFLYVFTLDTSQMMRIDDKTLWSPTEFLRAATSTFGRYVDAVKPAAWQTAVQALIIHVIEIVDTPGETLSDAVLEWLRPYTGRATTDREGAAAGSSPFIDDGHMHVHAGDFARHIRRELVEQVNRQELYQALRDLGFQRVTVPYVRGKGNTATRSTASYYRAPLHTINGDPGAA